MIQPVTNANTAAITTAPALTSLTWPALMLYVGETRSVRVSMAVLMSSVTRTRAILSATHCHSAVERCSMIPRPIAITVAPRCIRKLGWVLVAYCKPLKAKPKLRISLLIYKSTLLLALMNLVAKKLFKP